MSAVQIAGCSGAGKSTVAAVLARRGLVSIDADDDPLLARFVDLAGAVVAVATTVLLSLLGAAIGAGSIRAFDATSTDLANYGIGTRNRDIGKWEAIN